MYIVLNYSKTKEPLVDLMPELHTAFPKDTFSIHGSPDKGYKLHIEGIGDEVPPRVFATKFLKTWKPKPVEEEIK